VNGLQHCEDSRGDGWHESVVERPDFLAWRERFDQGHFLDLRDISGETVRPASNNHERIRTVARG
jgi:hypothetical protein